MWKFVATAKRVLWEFVELAFLVVLALILFFMLLGKNAGPYVVSVADNVTKFSSAPVPACSASSSCWRSSIWRCGG